MKYTTSVCVLPVLTCGTEIWSLTKQVNRRIRKTRVTVRERATLNIILQDRKNMMTWIKQQTKLVDAVERIVKLKWRWTGHCQTKR